MTIAGGFSETSQFGALPGDVSEIRSHGIVAAEESLAVFRACFKSSIKLVERASD
jgi:hypothetical protein